MTQERISVPHGGSFGAGAFGAGPFGGYQQFDEPLSGRADRAQHAEQWEECSRCGFTYPLSQLRLQTGDGGAVKVCTVIPCFDEPSVNDMRPDKLPEEEPYMFVDENGPFV